MGGIVPLEGVVQIWHRYIDGFALTLINNYSKFCHRFKTEVWGRNMSPRGEIWSCVTLGPYYAAFQRGR